VLIAAKEEEPIFDDWPTEREAGFIASRFWPRDAFLVEEEIVRIELFVLKVVVSTTVKSVPALLCYELEVAASGSSGRSVIEAGLQLHFLQSFSAGAMLSFSEPSFVVMFVASMPLKKRLVLVVRVPLTDGD